MTAHQQAADAALTLARGADENALARAVPAVAIPLDPAAWPDDLRERVMEATAKAAGMDVRDAVRLNSGGFLVVDANVNPIPYRARIIILPSADAATEVRDA